MKPFWEISESEPAKCFGSHRLAPAMYEYFGEEGTPPICHPKVKASLTCVDQCNKRLDP